MNKKKKDLIIFFTIAVSFDDYCFKWHLVADITNFNAENLEDFRKETQQ